jgi:cardiolipin synthase
VIFTIPNIISVIRIALVPVFLWLLLGRDDANSAGWLLGFIGATDWVDGYLARKLGQVSELGKFLDPAADRLAVAAAVIGGWISGDLPWGVCLAIVVREVIVIVGALIVGLKARDKVEVRYIGKVATLGLYFAISWFFVGRGTDTLWLEAAGWIAVIPSLVLYYVVAGQYLTDMRRILSEDGTVSSDA